jgi:hypothetical protein
MNARRGLFRLWLVIALAWLLGSAWGLRFELLPRCTSIIEQTTDMVWTCWLEHEESPDLVPQDWPTATRVTALEWVLLPPLIVFVLGRIGFWVANGFRRQ